MAHPDTKIAQIDALMDLIRPATTQEEQTMPKTTPITRDEIEASPSVLDADNSFYTDDISDPPAPASLLTAIATERSTAPTVDPSTVAGQVAMAVDEALERFTQSASPVLTSVEKAWESTLQVCQGNQAVIGALTAAVSNYAPVIPFSASVSVTSPSGFPMVLTVQERSQEAFLTAMGALMGFLQEHGFAPHIAAPF